MKHKKLFITFTVIFTVLLSLIIFLTLWFWGDTYKGGADYDGFDSFRAEIEIPGLKDGACPQGICSYKVKEETTDGDGNKVSETKNYFFISAYFKNSSSRVYVVEKNDGLIGYVTLKNTDGSDYLGHCGGIATNGRYIWITSDDNVFVITNGDRPSEYIAGKLIEQAKEKGEMKFTASFAANCNASFCFYYDADGGDGSNIDVTNDKLYVGEFYRPKNYETSSLHHLTTPDGYENKAFVYEYRVSTATGNKYGLNLISSNEVRDGDKKPKIDKIYSITDEIQGFARIGNGLALSQSYGLKNSHILYYDWEKISDTANRARYKDIFEGQDGFEYADVRKNDGEKYVDTSSTLYVYYIDKTTLLNDYSIPSMSEGLCVSGNRVHVLFESGAKKYRRFVRQVLSNVYSFAPKKSTKF